MFLASPALGPAPCRRLFVVAAFDAAASASHYGLKV